MGIILEESMCRHGKTTIVNLITRFYDIQGGSIFLGKNDIKEYKLSSLRSKIALVLQDVFLFADTILNNITLYNPNISFDHVVSAAKKIGIHDFIMSMPGGYNYNVKERGVMLSQGQRQLISFLSCLLYTSPSPRDGLLSRMPSSA